MDQRMTEKTIRQFIEYVSDQHYAMSGAVIAASAAQAAALGEACMQISLDNQVDKLDWQDVTARIEQMVHIKNTLTEWCDLDADAIAKYNALGVVNDEIRGQQQLLFESSTEVSRLSIEAALLLQDFRPLVFVGEQDDLELAINLLAGTARTAMLLLNSNLRIWPDPALLKEYEPILSEFEERLEQLVPVSPIQN